MKWHCWQNRAHKFDAIHCCDALIIRQKTKKDTVMVTRLLGYNIWLFTSPHIFITYIYSFLSKWRLDNIFVKQPYSPYWFEYNLVEHPINGWESNGRSARTITRWTCRSLELFVGYFTKIGKSIRKRSWNGQPILWACSNIQ